MFGRITDKTLETFYLTPLIHMDGNKELLIENCRRIEEYSEVFMRLISGKLCINIWGNGLRAYDFNKDGLMISGKISQIEFTERNGRQDEKSDKRLCED
ncbi:MAG: YabP/YqfC family sporulation protein [Ruminococcus sp.]|nr:YabP/YqfC family sporulation protein [Ruminococcus sp.]MDE6848657.1 YabP/YqfC family sporulation protein [Ruminococcus sp.]MDE7137047.1 YabP/YqfC family sporulation protein [Ruminococcus sp.]